MKNSLEHLPEKKKFEINHIVEIIREVVKPEMIVLFGSYAKGKQVEHRYKGRDGILYEYISDYDFLVVTQKVTQETSSQEWAIEERAEIYDPPVNLEIHEIDFINKGLEFGQYFFADIIKDGVLLFDTGNVKFTEPRQLTPAEEKSMAQENYSKWLKKASRALRLAKDAITDSLDEDDDFNDVAFLLHQSAERFYYTILLVFTGYKPKTHNLKKLRRKSKHLSEDLFLLYQVETDKHEMYLFDLLKRGYVDARYKANFSITEEEVRTLISRTEKMEELVKSISSKKIDSFEN